jgi:hypothetical protein
MVIQLETESNDICRGLFKSKEETINMKGKVAENIDATADRINDAKNSVIKKSVWQLLTLVKMRTVTPKK